MSGAADDCFEAGDRRISVPEALKLLRARVRPVTGVETVPLDEAQGRILAETVKSPRDVPAFDNTAVDGYAFAHRDLRPDAETRLQVVEGRAAAGHPLSAPVPTGRAARVLTGAPMPEGTDTVALQEEVSTEGGAVAIPPGLSPGANRRRAGEDLRKGAAALEPGMRLRPQDIGVAAEVGRATLEVFEPLRVALFSSGDELVEPGGNLPEGGVYDANRHILRALLRTLPCRVSDLGILEDSAQAVREAIAGAAAGHHVVLTSGGASRGDEDHVVRSVEDLGRLHFWQIAMKPGRPLAFGHLGSSVFVGLPGNPVAAVVCFLRFARPVLVRLAGGRWPEPAAYQVPAGFSIEKKPGRTELVRARLEHGAGGTHVVRRIAREGSGILTSLVEADGLVELGEAVTRVEEGDPVPFLPFTSFGLPC